MTPTPDAPVQQPSWFSRNWKWLIPVGCLVPLLCCGSFAGSIFFGVGAAIKNSGAYKQAITLAEGDADVQDALGTPLTGGLMVTGKLKNESFNGTADFNVAVEGPKGKGTLHVVGTSKSGVWDLSVVDVAPERGDVIHVLE
ncbi:MAG: cytochrome c oxidase assembly factor Coa1 family protein [Archangium sp.]